MTRFLFGVVLFLSLSTLAFAQYGESANTSGGSLKPEQAAYDVTFYELDLRLFPDEKFVVGHQTVEARIVNPVSELVLDLDDSWNVLWVGDNSEGLQFDHEGGVVRARFAEAKAVGEIVRIQVRYEGQPVEAARPPWDGGFSWEQTASGDPWVAVSCQGEGADIWWPVKDHPSDEPDSMRITLTVPENLRAIANGRHEGRTVKGDGTATEEWFVSTPINNYGVSFGVAPYEEVTQLYESPYDYEMPVTFYVLPERSEDAERQFPGFLDALNFLERTFGPYGFRADGYKVLHTPYLGMEHQSLIAYGSTFEDNEFGFDWLHFHELAHEWWANLGTAPDWSDFWIHESFANYAEALFAEDIARRNGDDPEGAYLAYMATVRDNIRNVQPVAPRESQSTKDMYNLPDGSFNGDIYFKGSWFLHTLRYLIDDDEAFFRALRQIMYPDPALESATDGSANHFITTADVQAAFERETGMDLSVYFEVYLRQPVLPILESHYENAAIHYRWVLPEGVLDEGQTFDLPIEVEWGAGPFRVEMDGGVGQSIAPRSSIMIDPNGRILFSGRALD